MQAWEYQPLGPFLAKNFATTVSPWVVTLEALAPYRVAFQRSPEYPAPLAYLDGAENSATGAFDIRLEAFIESAAMRANGIAPHCLSRTSFRYSFWTIAQLLTHHTINGCNLRPGDLLGSGTQSGPTPGEAGSLLELSNNGKQPITLSGGEHRSFLEDGDVVSFRGYCEAAGRVRIGFGEVSGGILPATEDQRT